MTEPIFFAIDTSTAQISVAIVQGETVLAKKSKIDALRHAELASSFIEECLETAKLTPTDIAIYLCGIGPGPLLVYGWASSPPKLWRWLAKNQFMESVVMMQSRSWALKIKISPWLPMQGVKRFTQLAI